MIAPEKKSIKTTVALQRRNKFCQEFLKCLNPIKAAEKAGYTGSAKTLGEKASHLFAEAETQAELERLRGLIDTKEIASVQECAEILTRQARGQIQDYWLFDATGRWCGIDMKRLQADGKGYLLEEIKLDTESVQYKWAKPRCSIETLAKLMGWTKESVQHVTVNLTEQIINVLSDVQGRDPRADPRY